MGAVKLISIDQYLVSLPQFLWCCTLLCSKVDLSFELLTLGGLNLVSLLVPPELSPQTHYSTHKGNMFDFRL